jgi:predicted phosphate transport protein (TIGR00153 family)
MAKQNGYDYFQTFVDLVEYSCNAANMLSTTLENYNSDDLSKKIEEIHVIEHNADLKKHEMMSNLLHEFIAPIEREDIIQLANCIDNITDAIEDVLLRIYMFNIKTIKPEALEFAKIICKCCDSLKIAMNELKHFKKSHEIKNLIIEVNRLEEDGDKLYTEAVRTLFESPSNPVETLAWNEAYNHFEICCDSCEDVADAIEIVIMKNS